MLYGNLILNKGASAVGTPFIDHGNLEFTQITFPNKILYHHGTYSGLLSSITREYVGMGQGPMMVLDFTGKRLTFCHCL